MEQKPSEITAALDEFLGAYLFPDKGDGSDPRLCPSCGTGRLALRGGQFGPFIACSNYPDCKFTRKFAQPGGSDGADTGPETMGNDPDSRLEVTTPNGSTSCRERVWQYGKSTAVAVSFKKKT